MATTVFSVVGEHRSQPHRLLLLGDDGHFYALASYAAHPQAVEPTDEWQIDPDVEDPSDPWSSDNS
jgi:hypothetical protein